MSVSFFVGRSPGSNTSEVNKIMFDSNNINPLIPVGLLSSLRTGDLVYFNGSPPARTVFTPPVVTQLLDTLDIELKEGFHMSSNDEKQTVNKIPTYISLRGSGIAWSEGLVSLGSYAPSSQFVLGNFGFNIPLNAVIKSVEVLSDKAVITGAATISTNVLACAFAAPTFNFNANIESAWVSNDFVLIVAAFMFNVLAPRNTYALHVSNIYIVMDLAYPFGTVLIWHISKDSYGKDIIKDPLMKDITIDGNPATTFFDMQRVYEGAL